MSEDRILNWRLGILARRHLPSASLGHYATLSLVVRGKAQRRDFGFRIGDFNFEFRNFNPMLFASCLSPKMGSL